MARNRQVSGVTGGRVRDMVQAASRFAYMPATGNISTARSLNNDPIRIQPNIKTGVSTRGRAPIESASEIGATTVPVNSGSPVSAPGTTGTTPYSGNVSDRTNQMIAGVTNVASSALGVPGSGGIAGAVRGATQMARSMLSFLGWSNQDNIQDAPQQAQTNLETTSVVAPATRGFSAFNENAAQEAVGPRGMAFAPISTAAKAIDALVGFGKDVSSQLLPGQVDTFQAHGPNQQSASEYASTYQSSAPLDAPLGGGYYSDYETSDGQEGQGATAAGFGDTGGGTDAGGGTPGSADVGGFGEGDYGTPGAFGDSGTGLGESGFGGNADTGVDGSDSGDSLICSECRRQGIISLDEMIAAGKFRKLKIGDGLFDSYQRWAALFVRKMRGSRRFSAVVAPFCREWVRYMAHRVRPEYFKMSFIGAIVYFVFGPVTVITRVFTRKKEV